MGKASQVFEEARVKKFSQSGKKGRLTRKPGKEASMKASPSESNLCIIVSDADASGSGAPGRNLDENEPTRAGR
jgi:hypothetical protein